jgi:hypothetical protein
VTQVGRLVNLQGEFLNIRTLQKKKYHYHILNVFFNLLISTLKLSLYCLQACIVPKKSDVCNYFFGSIEI